MQPVGPTGSGFSFWAPATKHLAFIFNHTSLSTNNVGRRQRPYLICQTDTVNMQTEKKITHTQRTVTSEDKQQQHIRPQRHHHHHHQGAYAKEISALEVTQPL